MLSTILKAMRLPFLLLTPVSILLGVMAAHINHTAVSSYHAVLALIAGILAHISVNTLNEYQDYKSGLDAQTDKTPFSGGSGALVDNPQAAPWVLAVAWVTLGLTIAIGGFFVWQLGGQIIPLGLLGCLIIVTYTQWLNRYPMVCLIAPGLAFGPLMVLGTYWVLTGEYSGKVLWLSLLPFWLCNNLLLLNQLPDIEADKQVGRRHWAICYGVHKSLLSFALMSLMAVLVVVIGVLVSLIPALSLIALLPLLATPWIYAGCKQNVGNNTALLPYLGANVVVTLTSPLLLSLVIGIG